MTRTLLLIALISACGKHAADTTPQCEKARDQFLANYNERMTALLAEDNDTQKVSDKKQADIEIANAKIRFVASCKNTPDFKLECFESVAKEDSPACKKFIKTFSHAVVQPVVGS